MTIANISRFGFVLAALVVLSPVPALADDLTNFEDVQFGTNLGMSYSSGNYGLSDTTRVMLALASVSAATGDFKFTASMPYISMSGHGLVVFDASGNAILINRRASTTSSQHTGWGDLNISTSYTVPPVLLDGFAVRFTGVTKLPTAGSGHKLSTGQIDFGGNLDVSKQFGLWTPFITVGYLDRGRPKSVALSNTTSMSAGTSLELSDNLVAIASYDYDSPDSAHVRAGHELFGSLSWVRPNGFTVTGYGTAGLSAGAPNVGCGFLISYSFK